MAKNALRNRNVRVGVLVYHGCSAWIVAGILEAFELVNVLAAVRTVQRRAISFKVCMVSERRETISATSGVKFRAVSPSGWLDVLVVPPVWHRSSKDLSSALARLAPTIRVLRTFARRSRLVTSACSGSVLLAEAGLLRGTTATTCWWLTDWFRSRYPDVRVASDRLFIAQGTTWTAGAGTAYIHLCLKIIDCFAGRNLSTVAARLLLVEPNRETQAPYFSGHIVPASSEAISCLEKFVAKHISRSISLSELASAANMSLRSLFRYLEKEKGATPLQFVQGIRIERAKVLLERTTEPMDSIVPKCGYEDVSSFRKLFRKRVGMTPKDYRQRFGNAPQ